MSSAELGRPAGCGYVSLCVSPTLSVSFPTRPLVQPVSGAHAVRLRCHSSRQPICTLPCRPRYSMRSLCGRRLTYLPTYRGWEWVLCGAGPGVSAPGRWEVGLVSSGGNGWIHHQNLFLLREVPLGSLARPFLATRWRMPGLRTVRRYWLNGPDWTCRLPIRATSRWTCDGVGCVSYFIIWFASTQLDSRRITFPSPPRMDLGPYFPRAAAEAGSNRIPLTIVHSHNGSINQKPCSNQVRKS